MRLLLCLLALGALPACGAGAQNSPSPRPASPGMSGTVVFDPHILVDQFGYLPGESKVAVIRDPHVGYDSSSRFFPGMHYQVRRASDGQSVFAGDLVPWNKGEIEASSGDAGWWFDFSALDVPDTYFVYDVDRNLRSATFRIDPQVYRDVLKAAMRTYFYQRSGIAKQPPHADACWVDDPAYMGPDQDTQAHDVTARNDASKVRDVSGGWFDAGDTNKYVTFANVAVHQLLTAYQDNPAAFTDDFNIPESGNGVPDLLDEVRWELDWLQKMQDPNGGVALKVGTLKEGYAAPPSRDGLPRYYVPACTSATIATAGMFAHGAYVFGSIPQLAEQGAALRRRAEAAWRNFRLSAKQTSCDSGAVLTAKADWSEADQNAQAVVAAVYLFALTGDSQYDDYIKTHYRDLRPYHDMGWSRYDATHGEALLFYTTLPGADAALKSDLLADKLADVRAGNHIYGFIPGDDLYRAYLHDPQYHWGSNQPRANYGNSNIDALLYEPSVARDAVSYRTRALEMLHYFHGVNPFATVYLSNMYQYGATRSVDRIWHMWFRRESRWSDVLQSACGPAPGYLPGGPNASAASSLPASLAPPAGQPAQKAYRVSNQVGPEDSWIYNEPAIYYQAAYVRLLSYFVR
ncbi:MAG: glycoside hydrolase family 9 protein [Steroidobacteraceae bacterium]